VVGFKKQISKQLYWTKTTN